MQIYFVNFELISIKANSHEMKTDGAMAYIWVKANSCIGAFSKARFFIEKDEWSITKFINVSPVIREIYLNYPDGLKLFDQAESIGYAITYIGWNKEIIEPIEFDFRIPEKIDRGQFYKNSKPLYNKGVCLHFNSGEECDFIIEAHSIQKSQSLSSIAVNGHVYQPKFEQMRCFYSLTGIKKTSTFRGFCKLHDDALFKPIDTNVLLPNEEQAFLYAYRSICREIFVKNRALNVFNTAVLAFNNKDCAEVISLHNLSKGTLNAINQLNTIKKDYDKTAKSKNFNDIKYLVFKSTQIQNIAFSGLIFPDYDFQGEFLQNVALVESKLSLLTFCSAPMENGWGIIFAWHQESSGASDAFISSLAQVVADGKSIEDSLFRFIIKCCENHALSPTWWDALPEIHKKKILDCINENADPLVLTSSDYLTRGLEKIVDWQFNSVITNIRKIN